jgi:hypothetical protein|nr:MAG TPA: hypothetical protein [Caudoviricetes sp.]
MEWFRTVQNRSGIALPSNAWRSNGNAVICYAKATHREAIQRKAKEEKCKEKRRKCLDGNGGGIAKWRIAKNSNGMARKRWAKRGNGIE